MRKKYMVTFVMMIEAEDADEDRLEVYLKERMWAKFLWDGDTCLSNDLTVSVEELKKFWEKK